MDDILRKLKKFKNYKFPVLTMILSNIEKRTQLHDLIHKNLDKNQQVYFRKDLDKIKEYLNESFDRKNKRSVAFFSSPDGFWEVLEFEFSLAPVCTVSYSPYLKSIQEGIKKHQKYLVVLVDRQRARFFTVHLGKVEDVYDYFSTDVPQRVKAKKVDWGRYDKIPRHIEEHLRRHLKIIGQLAKTFIVGKNIHFILIGSHKELFPKIKYHLKYPLKSMVKGVFVTELNIPLNNILKHSKNIAAGVV